MRSFATLLALSAVSSAADLGHSLLVNGQLPANVNVVPYCQDCLDDFSWKGHVRADNYGPSKSGPFPSADYNRKVYQFEDTNNIFDQGEYEARVQAEADLMIALEALKQTIVFLRKEVDTIREGLVSERSFLQSSVSTTKSQLEAIVKDLSFFMAKRTMLQDECQYMQHEIDDNRDALVLYCQQFAFAPDMVGPCSRLLTCNEKGLYMKYHFTGEYKHEPVYAQSYGSRTHVEGSHDHSQAHASHSQQDHGHVSHDHHDLGLEHDHHDHSSHDHGSYEQVDPHASSHGIKLNIVGGNVDVAPGTHAELAAAAVSPTTAVLQSDGKTIIAPMDEIDPDAVELACDDDGCALIPDDGNPYNDIIVEGMDHHGHDPHYDHVQDHHEHDPAYDQHAHEQHSHDQHSHDHEDHYDIHDHAAHSHFEEPQRSTHGMELNMVGGHADVAHGTNAELAAAAVSSTEAVIQYDGETVIVPIDQIDPDKVELACIDDGCALIPDDGNPYNDIVVDGHAFHDHDGHDHHDHAHHDHAHPDQVNDHHEHDPVLVQDYHEHDHALSHDQNQHYDVPDQHEHAHFDHPELHPDMHQQIADFHPDMHSQQIPEMHPEMHPDMQHQQIPEMHPETHTQLSHDYSKDPYADAMMSSHGIILNEVGGHAQVAHGIDPELAAAAVDSSTVVIQHNGQSFYAPIDQVDTSMVELACADDGCALIPDDGNPYNDIIAGGHDLHGHDHAHDHHVHDPAHVQDYHEHDHAHADMLPEMHSHQIPDLYAHSDVHAHADVHAHPEQFGHAEIPLHPEQVAFSGHTDIPLHPEQVAFSGHSEIPLHPEQVAFGGEHVEMHPEQVAFSAH